MLSSTDLSSTELKSQYHNLIAELDSKDPTIRAVEHSCNTGQIAQVLHHFLSGLPEAPLEPTLFRAFFECCFLASRGDSEVHCGTASARAKLGELSSGEVDRIKIARILFCLMPKAHSDALEYLLILFLSLIRPASLRSDHHLHHHQHQRKHQNHYNHHSRQPSEKGKEKEADIDLATPTPRYTKTLPTLGEVAQSFGWDVCGPRDAVGFLASSGLLSIPMTESFDPQDLTQVPLVLKERAEAAVQRMSVQVLWWLMCYWGQIAGWREDRATLEKTKDWAPARVYATKPSPSHRHGMCFFPAIIAWSDV